MDLNDTNLEISIEPSSNLNHEQTPVAGASSVPQDESRGLNEMTPEDLDSLKKQVCEYARKDKWKEAESIFNKYADMVRIPLTDQRDTALQVAMYAKSITFVKGLVNLMTIRDLYLINRLGLNAFDTAGKSGNSDLVQLMNEILHDIDSSKKQVCEYAGKDNWKEAESIFNKYPDMVRIALNANGDTALHLAVSANSITFVKGLVNLMIPPDLQIYNRWGYTAFFMAGNTDLAENMKEKFQQLEFLKKQVFDYASEDKWKEAESIFNKYADMVRVRLTDDGDIALHVAVHFNSITFVEGLVNLMTPIDLQIQNRWGLTAFSKAAWTNSDLAQIMLVQNVNLALIKSYEGLLPVHWAAIGGHHILVQNLSYQTLLQMMDIEAIEKLFFLTIEHNMFGVATKIFEEYPAVLADARGGIYGTEEQRYRTVLEMLLRKNKDPPRSRRPVSLCKKKDSPRRRRPISLPKKFSSEESLLLLQKIWLQRKGRLGRPGILELIRSGYLLSATTDALESGNVKAAEWLLSDNPELLHQAVLQRHSSIPNIFKKVPEEMLQAVDDDDNNILHLAAYYLKKEENSSSLKATTKITREIAWFKKVEKKVPPELQTKKNREGMTPEDVFKDKHKDLSREVKDTAKGIANSGMLVAALVATVAFAAALVVPGDKTNPWFIVFILANAAALFSSSASILTFLSNFTTSRFADSEFVIALHPSLIFGPSLLLISIVTMTISFAAASFLIFEHTSKWVAYVVTSMGVLPILLFLLFQFSIFDTHLWSRYYHMS